MIKKNASVLGIVKMVKTHYCSSSIIICRWLTTKTNGELSPLVSFIDVYIWWWYRISTKKRKENCNIRHIKEPSNAFLIRIFVILPHYIPNCKHNNLYFYMRVVYCSKSFRRVLYTESK